MKGSLYGPAARISPSRRDQIDRLQEIDLPDIDAVVAQDRVGGREVEVGVGHDHLQQIVLAADDLARAPRRS